MLNRGRFNQFVFNGRVAVVAKLVALAGSLVVNSSTAADVNISAPLAGSVSSNVVVSAPL